MRNRVWRQPVTAWFRGLNQLWVEGNTDRIFCWVKDEQADWVQAERERWRRIREQQDERELKPLKGETRIQVIREEEAAVEQIKMEVLVHHRYLSTVAGHFLEQEEVNGYRLQLEEGANGWEISHCEQNRERASDAGKTWSYYHPPEEHVSSRSGYDRMRAVQYAETWWNGHNPRYAKFADDCTNYISQCLHAGGIPMEFTMRRDRGWWYKGSRDNWSYSWTVAHSFHNYLAGGGNAQARPVGSPGELNLGDVICYDWDGNGRWQHNTIVTAIDPAGMPLVNSHTVDSRHRYWDCRDSYAWTPRTKYRFFQIGNS
ncbi:amidase domain-containing protein [Marinithermofilum abyssi]|uniref:amidase domain-containing protein n=1 Tax=Marinithermofilum abyssi TaxID=1571185 RepID=UPI001667732A|nr:amidase domain-containing protein [Marinithermofilum abyssi]